MKKIALLATTVVVLLLSIGTKENDEKHKNDIKIKGPSSVAALNTHFTSQEHLDDVFEKWLNQFDHTPSDCEKINTNLRKIDFPSLYAPELIEVKFEVLNTCENKLYIHKASFELVVLDEDLMA